MNISPEINARIDEVLKKNRVHEIAIFIMAAAIFILGLAALVYGIVKNEVLIVAPATLINAALYWPIQQIRRIRKENIMLAAIPSLIATLPPEDAARELVKLLDKIT